MAKKTEATPAKKRVRNPEATREAILKAARTVLSEDGPEGLSVSRVANLAGVNRGTAYQHFATREELLQATADWVAGQLISQGIFAEAFDGESAPRLPPKEQPVYETIERMVNFAVENPELGRIWLFGMLGSEDPAGDPFFDRYKKGIEALSQSGAGREDVDSEPLSVIVLAGIFLWPVWVQAHAKSKREQAKMTKRFSRELLRFCMYGTLKPQKYPKLVALLKEEL